MLNLFGTPSVIETQIFSSMPQRYRRTGQRSAWADANKGGIHIDCFIEGPSFDRAGNSYIVDIPYGRILRISQQGDWELVAEYEGEPNGLKIHRDGRIFITDYRNGLMVLNPDSGRVAPFPNRIGNRDRPRGPHAGGGPVDVFTHAIAFMRGDLP